MQSLKVTPRSSSADQSVQGVQAAAALHVSVREGVLNVCLDHAFSRRPSSMFTRPLISLMLSCYFLH